MNATTLKAAPQGAAPRLAAAQVAPAGARALPNLEMPYSRVIINDGEAADHAAMRTRQLVDLLDVIGGEGPSDLMWLAQQIARELIDVVYLIGQDERTGAPA